jgi:hypothetical protein
MRTVLNLTSLQNEIQKFQGNASRSSIQTNYFDQSLLSRTFKVTRCHNG